MDDIIIDSFYLVSLFMDRFKEISLFKLNELMFVTHLESLLTFEEGFYPNSFSLNLYGVYNEQINIKYMYMINSVLITKDEYEKGRTIENYKKAMLYKVYKKYGGINEHKLNELLHSNNSPLCVDEDPYMLAYIMKYKKVLDDKLLTSWFENFSLD